MEIFFQNIELIRGLNMCNNVPNPLLVYIIDEIMKLNKNMNNSFDKVLIKNFIKKEKIKISENDVDIVLDTLVNLYRILQKKDFQPKKLQTFLAENTILQEPKQILLVQRYEEDIEQRKSEASKILSLGKLIGLKWQVCSYLNDKKYENLNKMYILLNISVQNPNGQVFHETLNMSLSEFKAFQEIVRQISEAVQNYTK